MKFFAKMFSPEGRRLKAASPYQAGDLKQAISFVIRVFVLLLLCYLGTLAWGVYLARQNAQLQKFNEQIYALNSHIGTVPVSSSAPSNLARLDLLDLLFDFWSSI